MLAPHFQQQSVPLSIPPVTRFSSSQYALILGASSGFGAAAARALSARGMSVIGVHLDRAAGLADAERLRDEIVAHGVEALFFNVNAADADRRREVLDTVAAHFAERPGARVHLLLHSLAFGALKPLVAAEEREALTQAQVEMTMNVMANSLVYWTQEIVRRGMMEGGRIAALTSSGARRVLPHYGAVSAAKAALESWCRQLAFELGPHGITVNALQAGVTDTPALRKIPGNDQLISHALERNPLGRLTTPEDVARILVTLCSEEGGWINGETLRIDGGEDVVELDWTRQSVQVDKA